MGKGWLLEWLIGSWVWLKALFSLDRVLREMRSMPYRGQPVIWTKRGLRVRPRTLRGRWRRASES